MTLNDDATSWESEPVKQGEIQHDGKSLVHAFVLVIIFVNSCCIHRVVGIFPLELVNGFQKTMYLIEISILGRGTMKTTIVTMDRESLSECDNIPCKETLPAKAPKVKREKNTDSFSLHGQLKDTVAICPLEKESSIPFFVELAAMAGAKAILLKDNVLTKKIQANIPIFSIPVNTIDAIGNATSAFVTFKESYLTSELGVEVNDFAYASHPCKNDQFDGDFEMMLETEESPTPMGKGIPNNSIIRKKLEEPPAVFGNSENATISRPSFDILFSSYGKHSTEPSFFNFISDCSDCDFLVGTTIEVTKPIIYRNGKRELSRIGGDMKNKIVLCDLKLSFEIDQYVQMAFDNNATAVFLTGGKSLSRFPIPIFVVPSKVNQYVQNMKSTLAYFDCALTSTTTQVMVENSTIDTGLMSPSSDCSSNIYNSYVEHKYSARQGQSYADVVRISPPCDGLDIPDSMTVNSYAGIMDKPTEQKSPNAAHLDFTLKNNPSDDGAQEPNKKGLWGGAVRVVSNVLSSLFPSQSEQVNNLFRVVEWKKTPTLCISMLSMCSTRLYMRRTCR